MKPGRNPFAEEVRYLLIDAEHERTFPDVQTLLARASTLCGGKYAVWELAVVGLCWNLFAGLVTPTPPAWRSLDYEGRQRIASRIKRTRSLHDK